MKISLKNLEIHPRQSEETTAFDADVWIDGVRVGSATNNGRGGESRVHWIVPQERRREIEDVLKARVPAGYRANGTVWAIDKIVTAAAKRASDRGHARPITEVSIRDAQEAASLLGDARTQAIVGRGGLSGATEAELRQLVKEAVGTLVKRAARNQQAKKTPAQLDAEIAASLSGAKSERRLSIERELAEKIAREDKQIKSSPRRARPASKLVASAATFSVMLQLPDDPRFSIPGMTLPPMYGPAATGLQRDEAVVIAKRTQEDTGRHVRVYVDGRNYDTADFGPRPVGYKPRSITAKILPGVPMAR
jgi:hypothetical protein